MSAANPASKGTAESAPEDKKKKPAGAKGGARQNNSRRDDGDSVALDVVEIAADVALDVALYAPRRVGAVGKTPDIVSGKGGDFGGGGASGDFGDVAKPVGNVVAGMKPGANMPVPAVLTSDSPVTDAVQGTSILSDVSDTLSSALETAGEVASSAAEVAGSVVGGIAEAAGDLLSGIGDAFCTADPQYERAQRPHRSSRAYQRTLDI